MSAWSLRFCLASLVSCTALASLPAGEDVKPRPDAFGDPLPAGALARLGTIRFRLDQPYFSLALSPDGKRLAAGRRNGGISLLDTTTGLEVRKIQPAAVGGNEGMSFSPDGSRLVLTGFQGVQVLDLPTGNAMIRLPRNGQGRGGSTSFSADGKLLAVGGENFGQQKLSALVWDLQTKKQIASLEALHDHPLRVCLSADGKMLATWGQSFPRANDRTAFNQVIQLWDVTTGKELRRLTIEGYTTSNVAFSPDGKQLAAVEAGAMLSLWDPTSGKLLRRHAMRNGSGAILRYSPDGKTLLVSAPEGVFQSWDPASGKRLRLTRGPDCYPSALAFAGDKVLAAGNKDQAICLWEVSSGRELSSSSSRSTRSKSRRSGRTSTGARSMAHKRTPFFEEFAPAVKAWYERADKEARLTDVNLIFLQGIAGLLGLKTCMVRDTAYPARGGKTERLLAIARAAGADRYLSGPSARDYFDEAMFRAAGVTPEWMSYQGYPEYPQQHGEFEHAVTALDLLFNTGPEAPKKWTPEISVEYSLRGCLSWRIEPIENIALSSNWKPSDYRMSLVSPLPKLPAISILTLPFFTGGVMKSIKKAPKPFLGKQERTPKALKTPKSSVCVKRSNGSRMSATY